MSGGMYGKWQKIDIENLMEEDESSISWTELGEESDLDTWLRCLPAKVV